MDFSQPLDYMQLDKIYVMALAFGNITATTLITAQILKRYPSRLSAWRDRPQIQDGVGLGAVGNLPSMIDAVKFLRKHGFQAALPAALYDICRHVSAVSYSYLILSSSDVVSVRSGWRLCSCGRIHVFVDFQRQTVVSACEGTTTAVD